MLLTYSQEYRFAYQRTLAPNPFSHRVYNSLFHISYSGSGPNDADGFEL